MMMKYVRGKSPGGVSIRDVEVCNGRRWELYAQELTVTTGSYPTLCVICASSQDMEALLKQGQEIKWLLWQGSTGEGIYSDY